MVHSFEAPGFVNAAKTVNKNVKKSSIPTQRLGANRKYLL